MNMSNCTDAAEADSYMRVRVWASAAAFLILFVFNLLISWTIVREPRLRGHARFVLVFHLLVSACAYFALGFAFHLQAYQGAGLPPASCAALVMALTTSACSILLTITAMALDRYVAICFPLRYGGACRGAWPWLLGALTWGLAAVIPLTLYTDVYNRALKSCDRTTLKGGEVHKILLISACTLLILYSYARILCEGRRLGVLNRRNRAGCRTIALHGAQLAVYILPNFVNFVLHVLMKRGLLSCAAKERFAVIVFVFFSLAQCIAPVVYGLRKEELLEHLRHRFPCLNGRLKTLLEWTVGVVRPHGRTQQRERRMTSETLLSREISQTSV
ncbi:probable G-protein coupled receptor 148 [Salminus brasiliensis]|uniref:probable G-protein coupled receptor 148 n=1 Tax=Salminus brasiliensis TaxID=930266 RepID=UPI003B832CD5